MSRSTPTSAGWRWRCLPVPVAVVLLLGAAGAAQAKTRTTPVVGYVSAGAPVGGARMSVYGPSGRPLQLRTKRSAARTNVNGFFHLVVAGRPKLVRVVARGGKLKRRKVRGSLQAFVRRPSLDRTVHVDPVTTVIAAYRIKYPNRSLAAAERMTRRLLKLESDDPTGRALRSVTPDFNGLAFMREAGEHDGVQSYVDDLIREDKPVAFRATGFVIPPSLTSAVKMLTTAKDALMAVKSIGTFAYDFYKWASNEQDTDTKILEAVQKMQTQLNDIQNILNRIHDELGEGFQRLEDDLEGLAFANSIAPLQDLAGKIAATQGYFDDIVNNKLAGAPDFSQELADTRTQDIRANMNEIVRGFQRVNNVFRNAILKAQTDSAYYHAGQNLLSRSRHFMTPDNSKQLRNFAEFVLQYQTYAFNLIVRWETHISPARPTTTLLNAVKLYLGFDNDQALKDWVSATGEPVIPDSGDLHDEIAYLATIQAVPKETVVQADGLENTPGVMWQAKDPEQVLLGRAISARPGQSGIQCSNYLDGSLPLADKGPACANMAVGWEDGWAQLRAAAAKLPLTGWGPATAAQAQTLFSRTRMIPRNQPKEMMELMDRYWFPLELTTNTSQYYVRLSSGGRCNPNDYTLQPLDCNRFAVWIDEVNATIHLSDPAKGFKTSCRFGVGGHPGGNCPELYALLQRTPAPDERYWPGR